MAGPEELVLPVNSEVNRRCYPLERTEYYLFDDNSVLIRKVPYWAPAKEEYVPSSGGTPYVDQPVKTEPKTAPETPLALGAFLQDIAASGKPLRL